MWLVNVKDNFKTKKKLRLQLHQASIDPFKKKIYTIIVNPNTTRRWGDGFCPHFKKNIILATLGLLSYGRRKSENHVFEKT